MLTELERLSRPELFELLRSGHPIDPSAIAESEYRGTSLGLPRLVEALTWKTFVKAFHRDRESGVVRGWNVRLEQRREHAVTKRGGVPVTFGHYHVVSADEASVRSATARLGLGHGLVLHYGRGARSRFDPLAAVRDPLVALAPGNADRLLGWSYLDVGGVLVRTPSFFVLERLAPVTHIPADS